MLVAAVGENHHISGELSEWCGTHSALSSACTGSAGETAKRQVCTVPVGSVAV